MLEATIVVGLASWRVTSLVSQERGPWHIFQRLREARGFSHDDDGRPSAWPDNMLNEMIACPWCLGLSIAAVTYGVWQIAHWPVTILAAAAVLVSVNRYNNG